MDKNVLGSNEDKITEFLKVYEELFNTLEYNEEYGETAKIEDQVDNLSAYQIKEKNIERTQKYKKGDSKMLAMRLSHELSNLDIENHLMITKNGNKENWVNLYKDNEQWKVANIAEHLEDKNNNSMSNDAINEYYVQTPIEEYMLYNPKTYIVEDIKEDGTKLEDLSKEPYYSMQPTKRQQEMSLILREKNIFKRIINYIKYSFKQTIEDLGWDQLFKPVETPKNIENKEELSSESERTDFVPKIKVDEAEAIRIAEEKAQEAKIDDRSKEQ